MRKLDLFKSTLISALDRSYFLDSWINDDSLVTILNVNYDLDFINKYILVVYLEFKCFDYFIHKLKNRNPSSIKFLSFILPRA